MKTNSNQFTIYISLGFLVVGLLLGWLIFGRETNQPNTSTSDETHMGHDHLEDEVWTCSMHPQIRQDNSGQCPICGMDLIPATVSSDVEWEGAVQMTPASLKIANVQTVRVEVANPKKEIFLNGRVKVDERRISEITAHYNGRIERLLVNVTGQEVQRGQPLASVYSPQLVTAQKELFEAFQLKETNPTFFEAAVNKLKLWDLTDQQIEKILESEKVRYNFDVLSPRSGTIVTRNVNAGDHIYEGQSMFEVASLHQVWVVFDIYESDLPWIKEGDEISFTVQSLPGKEFASEISFIDPVISPERRVAQVRTELKNEGGELKPHMYAQGVLQASLATSKNELVIPKSAVLWTGKRAVVYVKEPGFDQPTFSYREVVLGPEAGGQYVVNDGLQEGEEIVANGVFKVDAAAQLQGKVSMMNPKPSSVGRSSAVHNHAVVSQQFEAAPNQSFEQVPAEFQEQLRAVIKPYLELKNALVASDAKEGTEAAQQINQAIEQINISLVSGAAQQRWMKNQKVIQQSLNDIQSSNSLETQREAFAPLSEALYRSIREFNVTSLDMYYQYCPMADSDQGAYWLSELLEINNPYFGESMLRCGETRETLD